ncbi:NAD(P)/FAD-dependent oxidoreductase [Flavobacterium sp.]|uniref:NAD(P)/FAD-dependent oxidoreductase n=1 Tax=Flavobacterium sp. TaxID=239 RepID=UPI0033429BDC
MKHYDVILVGGGAAGFFTAINLVEKHPHLKVAILERGKEVLSKVRISGGGRCNVTHACFVPSDLVKNYPRGEKELLGPFNQFCTGDTIAWFEQHGVSLKIEEDGRMFPTTDSSETIIDCFLKATRQLDIQVLTQQSVQSIFRGENYWKIETQNEHYSAEKVVITTGSNPKIWELLAQLGHTIVEAVPSLFTFNCKDSRIKDLMGLSTPAIVSVAGTKLSATGPLLITHWGMSGPGILRLSAWGARILAEKKYQCTVVINWLPEEDRESCVALLKTIRGEHSKKKVARKAPVDLPNRLWDNLVQAAGIADEQKWADVTNKQLQQLAEQLTHGQFQVNGKSTFKEEFVTAGGIDLKEVNFKTMESKLLPHLYFAGEVVNIDAITGGFNFQNAWTGGFIIANNV